MPAIFAVLLLPGVTLAATTPELDGITIVGAGVIQGGRLAGTDAGAAAAAPTGAPTARTLAERFADTVSVKDFGAKGDGTTNDTAAFTAALASGREVYVPSGTYAVCGVSLPAKAHLRGAGTRLTVLKATAGCNADVVSTPNAESLLGTGSYTSTDGWALANLTIDGNRTQQTSTTPDAVNCLAVYGSAWTVENVILQQCLGHGLRSGWAQYGETAGGLEAKIDNLTIDTTGRHGWWNSGPHDIVTNKLVVIDASQEADNTYSAMFTEGYSSGQHNQFHAWHRGATTNRVNYAVSTSGGQMFTNSHFEGGRAWFYVRSGGSKVADSAFYGSFATADGASLILLAGQYSAFTGNSYSGPSGFSVSAFQFGTSGSAAWANQINGGFFNGFGATPFNFVNSGGYNSVNASGYSNSASDVYLGTLSLSDCLRYYDKTGGVDACGYAGGNWLGTAGTSSRIVGGTANTARGWHGAGGGQYSDIGGYWSFGYGQNVKTTGAASSAFGYGTTDRGRWGAHCVGSNKFGGTQGSGQSCTQQLGATITDATATRLLANGTTMGSDNSLNGLGTGLHYHLTISATCQDTTATTASWASWDLGAGDLDNKSATGATYAGAYSTATAPTRSAGALAGAKLTVSADNDYKALKVLLTPPTGNANTLRCVAHVTTLAEVQ